MPIIHAHALEHELTRWTRPDAHRFTKADWRRFTKPGSELEAFYDRFELKYRSDQPRVPAGNPDGGQWTSEGGGGRSAEQPRRTSQVEFGILVAEIPLVRGRLCVYQFGNLRVVVPGPTNFHCPASTPMAGTTHGQILNDN